MDEVEQLRIRLDEVRSHFTRLTVYLQQRRLKRAETRLSRCDALIGFDGCILDDYQSNMITIPVQNSFIIPIINREPPFGSVDLMEPVKRQSLLNVNGSLAIGISQLGGGLISCER